MAQQTARRRWNHHRLQPLYDKAWLEEHYMKPGVTYQDLANLLSCSKETVKERVRAEGFPNPIVRDHQLAAALTEHAEPPAREAYEPVMDCYNCERHLCTGCPLIREAAHAIALRLMGRQVPIDL